MLSQQNKYALDLFELKTKQLIFMDSFPITLRIYLVPKLNVLTISRNQCEVTTVDDLLSNLIDYDDSGKHLSFKETQQIVSGSDERLYKWLHSYAGLHLRQPGSTHLEGIKFVESGIQDQQMTSFNLFTKIYQRAISRAILNWQTKNLHHAINEMPKMFQNVKEFQIFSV